MLRNLFMDKKFYTCCNYKSSTHRNTYVSDHPNVVCPSCSRYMNSNIPYVDPRKVVSSSGSGDGGFVKRDVTYMVMDDLEVKPMSTASSITVLTMFNVKDVGSIEVKDVDFGVDEVMELLCLCNVAMLLFMFIVIEIAIRLQGLMFLKAALSTQSVLTTVFLG